MSVTSDYSRAHRAFIRVAHANAMSPWEARLLVAICELGDGVTTQGLHEVLDCEGSSVRRSLGVLYERSLACGTGPGGSRRRQGVRSEVSLTVGGRILARRALALIHDEPATEPVRAVAA